LARHVKAIAISVNLVESLVEGTIEDCLFREGEVFEIFHSVAVDLQDQIGADTDQVGIGYGCGVLGRGRLGTEIGSAAKTWVASQKGHKYEKPKQTYLVHGGGCLLRHLFRTKRVMIRSAK